MPFNFLDRFLTKDSGKALGIDIGSSSIKAIQLSRKKGRAQLDTYGEISLGPYVGKEVGQPARLPVDKTAEVLTDLLKEANITAKNCGVSIPFDVSLVSIIEMPDLGRKKLNEMIPLEARKYVPGNISDMFLDWLIMPQEKKRSAGNEPEKVSVLVVAIHNEAIKRYQEIIKKAGLNLGFIELEMFSTIRSVSEEGSGSSEMIIDIGASKTKVYIVDNNSIRKTHIVGTGSQNVTRAISTSGDLSLTRAEEIKREEGLLTQGEVTKNASLVMNNIFSEAKRALAEYETANRTSVDKVILTGGGSSIQNLLTIAEPFFKTKTVLSEAFSKIETPAFMEEVLKKASPEFTVSIGLALRMLEELQ